MKCPQCGFDSPPEMRYCGMCGTHLARVCPACGFANPANYRFCGSCGARLVEEAVSSAEPLFPVKAEEFSAQPSPAAIQLEGERREVTVVLTDLTGSTNLLEKVGSEAWVELMNKVLRLIESEIYRFGGEVNQFRGDGLVAFFGATSAHEDDPERAVLAALSMQQALRLYAGELVKREDIDLRMRVGVDTGEVIVASVGDRRQYSEDTAMGMAVAIAARMEAAAEPGTVLVSEHTYRLVESQFEWQALGEIPVKGMSQPVAVYRPLAPKADAERLHPSPAFQYSIPLVGREAEFHTLKRGVEDLLEGRGRIVILTGDKGIGKSFLVNEVRHYFAHQGALLAEAHDGNVLSDTPLTWVRARCRSYGQAWPYAMWLDLLRDWLGTRQEESKQETLARLRRQAEALWSDCLAEYYPYLATALSLPLEETFMERVRHLNAEGLRQQFYLAIRSWVQAMARRGPLVLAFGDLQWADTASLHLLKYCLASCDDVALLWLLVFRSEPDSPVWEFGRHVESEHARRLTLVELSPLSEVQCRELIGWLIGSETLPNETRSLIIKNAEGNPYYIQELIRSLVADGVLIQDGDTGRWRMQRPVTTLDLPDSLQRLLRTHIDRLSPEERVVLQIAAVIGPVFWLNVLKALAGEAIRLKAHLAALQRAQLIDESGRVPELGTQYLFKSTLVRDAAYESLLSARRAAYHLHAAEHLEGLANPDILVGYYGMLAYHFQGAGRSEKELFYTLLAAEQAKRVYANAEAVERYTRALQLLDAMQAQEAYQDRPYAIRTQRFEVLNGRREVLYLMGQVEAGRSDAQVMLQLARQLDDDRAWLIDALLQQPGVAHWSSNEECEAGVPLAEEALALARQTGDRHREMESLFAIASQRYVLGDPAWQATAEHALELARELGDRRSETRILTALGSNCAWTDQVERGMAHLAAALPICQALGDKIAEVQLLGVMGLWLERTGDYHRLLREYLQKRLSLSREIGYRQGEAWSLIMCGQTQAIYLGDYEGGLRLLEAARYILEGMPDELFALLRIVQIQAVLGQHDQAQAVFDRMWHIGASSDVGQAGLCLVSAIYANTLGGEAHWRSALEYASQASQLMGTNPLLTRQYGIAAACESAAAHLGLVQCLADETERRVHLQLALQSSQAALDLYHHLGFVQIIECVSEEIFFRHGQALAANGYTSQAAEYGRRANGEMLRKHDLIPADSPFRQSYLANIALHREIRDAYHTTVVQSGDEHDSATGKN